MPLYQNTASSWGNCVTPAMTTSAHPFYGLGIVSTTAATSGVWVCGNQVYHAYTGRALSAQGMNQLYMAAMANGLSNNASAFVSQQAAAPPPPLTPEQIEARRVADEARRERDRVAIAESAERREKVKAASERARGLLLEHLTEEQRDTFEKNKWFVVEGGKTGTKYRIKDIGHTTANIDVLDNKGEYKHRLCCHIRTHVPLADNLLAQKIALQCDEERFVALANVHR